MADLLLRSRTVDGTCVCARRRNAVTFWSWDICTGTRACQPAVPPPSPSAQRGRCWCTLQIHAPSAATSFTSPPSRLKQVSGSLQAPAPVTRARAIRVVWSGDGCAGAAAMTAVVTRSWLSLTHVTPSSLCPDPGLQDDAGYSIAWGVCGHVFHLDCISRWLKTRSVCPLCNREWEYVAAESLCPQSQRLCACPSPGMWLGGRGCVNVRVARARRVRARARVCVHAWRARLVGKPFAYYPSDAWQVCQDREDRNLCAASTRTLIQRRAHPCSPDLLTGGVGAPPPSFCRWQFGLREESELIFFEDEPWRCRVHRLPLSTCSAPL